MLKLKRSKFLLIGVLAGILIGGGWLAYAAISQQVGVNVLTTAGAWTPVVGTSNSADGVAVSNTNINTDAFLYGWNSGGTVWDRIHAGMNGDAQSTGGMLNNFPYVYNGASLDRQRSASTTNLTLNPLTGVSLSLTPSNNSCTNTPGVGAQATCTIAAGAGTVRHVSTFITACVSTGVNPQTPLILNLIDGASAGTPIWSATLSAPATSSACIVTPMISAPGSATTAMTLEFAAAGVALSQETVALQALDVK